MIRVFIVDDHEVVRRGLTELFEAEEDIEVIGEAGTVADALIRIPLANADVAILDYRLPDGDGIEVCRSLHDSPDGPRCIMLTSFSDDEALAAFQTLCKLEGIIPALESAHALAYVEKLAPTLPKDNLLVVNLSGRGDKDVPQVAAMLGMKA